MAAPRLESRSVCGCEGVAVGAFFAGSVAFGGIFAAGEEVSLILNKIYLFIFTKHISS